MVKLSSLKNTFILTSLCTFTAVTIILKIVNNGNILTDGIERKHFLKKQDL